MTENLVHPFSIRGRAQFDLLGGKGRTLPRWYFSDYKCHSGLRKVHKPGDRF